MRTKRLLGIVVALITLLSLVITVEAGVTNPLPTELQLDKGESGRFQFQIQAVTSKNDLKCSYFFKEEPVFEYEFDEEETVVPSGAIRNVYGTVNVQDGLDYGAYTGSLCVKCSPSEEQAGASIVLRVCNLPLNVAVVEVKSRENMEMPAPVGFSWVAIIAAIATVLIGLIVWYIVLHGLHKHHQYKTNKAKKNKKGRR